MKLNDEILTWKGFGGGDAICRVQVFEDLVFVNRYFVIITELPENKGTSVTNAIEIIAGLVCQKFGLDLDRTTFVEHYVSHPGRGDAPETFDIVTFEDNPPAPLKRPEWTPTTWDVVRNSAADRHIKDWTEL